MPRFVLTNDAARTLSLIVVRARGYRPKSTGGHHYNTFMALETAEPAFKNQAVYFDGCWSRNTTEYNFAGGITETNAAALLKAVRQFAPDVEDWFKTHYPAIV
jgi:hypothetical protein